MKTLTFKNAISDHTDITYNFDIAGAEFIIYDGGIDLETKLSMGSLQDWKSDFDAIVRRYANSHKNTKQILDIHEKVMDIIQGM